MSRRTANSFDTISHMSMHKFISQLNIMYKQLQEEAEKQNEDVENNNIDTSSIINQVQGIANSLRA